MLIPLVIPRIVELLRALEVPGLDESWVQDWLGQVQLMEYINNIFIEWLTSSNGRYFRRQL